MVCSCYVPSAKTNRTEILHFRTTPEEKAVIKGLAGQAEVALSTWMRERSLDKLNPTQEFPLGAPGCTCPDERCMLHGTVPVLGGLRKPSSTQPVVDGVSLKGGERVELVPPTPRPEGGIYKVTGAGESYEQFMERRVGELLGDDASAEAQSQAQTTARAEWIASRPKVKK